MPTPSDTAVAMAIASTMDANESPAVDTSQSSPSIRFTPYMDPRGNRPSLSFAPITRTITTSGEVIRVGRYSERDGHSQASGNQQSSAPVGFKSKVVSRRHCEFWFEKGHWYIKDVKSSSGTFLNLIRLSPPSAESRPFPVKDGDVVQLGIDFKGGEEPIFRCVKIKLELNRSWQLRLNPFNMAAHNHLRAVLSDKDNGNDSLDCSICLEAIAPCQALFIAPCSHQWHYRCIREIINSAYFPIFSCPNCRATFDLNAEPTPPMQTSTARAVSAAQNNSPPDGNDQARPMALRGNTAGDNSASGDVSRLNIDMSNVRDGARSGGGSESEDTNSGRGAVHGNFANNVAPHDDMFHQIDPDITNVFAFENHGPSASSGSHSFLSVSSQQHVNP